MEKVFFFQLQVCCCFLREIHKLFIEQVLRASLFFSLGKDSLYIYSCTYLWTGCILYVQSSTIPLASPVHRLSNSCQQEIEFVCTTYTCMLILGVCAHYFFKNLADWLSTKTIWCVMSDGFNGHDIYYILCCVEGINHLKLLFESIFCKFTNFNVR